MSNAAATFDDAAREYERQLQQGISLSGESADYFVEGRVRFLANRLAELSDNLSHLNVMDFGCGIGNAAGALQQRLNARQIIGLDPSAESLSIAQKRHPGADFRWTTDGAEVEAASLDVVYTSGVFHHIEPEERDAILARIFRWLKPGGFFALFENNPWNPGTRWVMSRIPFDRDAKCLSYIEANRRMEASGFHIELTRTLFYFPRALRWLRPLEQGLLSRAPLGAQYVVLACRPR